MHQHPAGPSDGDRGPGANLKAARTGRRRRRVSRLDTEQGERIGEVAPFEERSSSSGALTRPKDFVAELWEADAEEDPEAMQLLDRGRGPGRPEERASPSDARL